MQAAKTTPHIYFCRYPSGLGYWRVRKPTRWNNATAAKLKAAHAFTTRLNTQLEQQH